MTPTNKMRYLVQKNIVTAAEVSAYRDANNLSLAEAKKELENAMPAKLQQWWSSGDAPDAGEWREIETVIEPSPIASHEKSTIPRARP